MRTQIFPCARRFGVLIPDMPVAIASALIALVLPQSLTPGRLWRGRDNARPHPPDDVSLPIFGLVVGTKSGCNVSLWPWPPLNSPKDAFLPFPKGTLMEEHSVLLLWG